MNPTHPSRPRNKLIAQAFFDMGIIERYGSGIKCIKDDCDKNGNPYPEWSDQHGEFATTYRLRVKCDDSKRQKDDGPIANIGFQSPNDALKNALKESQGNFKTIIEMCLI